MGKPRTSCWTCSLRHKKCDNELPTCRACRTLEIRCFNDADRPAWMDKGDGERSMRHEIQEELKRKARRRRHKAQLQKVVQDMAGCDDDDAGDAAQLTESSIPSSVEFESLGRMSLDPAPISPNTSLSSGGGGRVPMPRPDPFSPLGNELELSTIMSYLDCILPTIFPMYRPSLARGGRGWLLVRIMRSEALRHIIMSLSTHFFSAVPVLDTPERKICESWAVQEFQNRTVQAIGRVQRDIGDPGNWHAVGAGAGLLGKVHLLESVVHLMLLEVFTAHTDGWEMHLDAAVMLFSQIMGEAETNAPLPTPGGDGGAVDVLESLFLRIGSRVLNVVDSPSNTPWLADQAAFHFSASILVAADIISSVSFRKTPQLRHLHHVLLPSDGPSHEFSLQPQDIFGCSNAVLLILSDIAELDEWKRSQKLAGTFSIAQLATRGTAIEQKLCQVTSACSTTITTGRARAAGGGNTEAPNIVQYLEGALGSRHPETSKTTHIWILAARIFLHVVLSGWQPLSSAILEAVSDAVRLLQSVPSHILPGLAWPFCIISCVAGPTQEGLLRNLHRSAGATADFGTLGVAMAVTEEVWRQRAVTESDSWDITACMGVLGHNVLLL